MKFFLTFAILLAATPSMASRTSFQGGLGMSNGIFHLNIDVDFQKKRSHSFGGYLLYGSGNDTAGEVQRGDFWSLGGDLKVFFGPNNWRVYIAPGVGIISISNVAGTEEETTFGTLFKAGALTKIGEKMFLGLEQAYLQNWFSSKVSGTILRTTVAFRMDF